MNVFVTGASGYVGGVVVRSLLAAGHRTTALQRVNTDRPVRIKGCHVVEGDLFNPDAVATLMEGADAVVHLVGIIRELPRRNITMEHVHVDGTLSVLTAAKRAGAQRFLHMSALCARPNATSGYHKSKWAAEQLVRASGLKYTIFQPSVIFGRGGPGPEFVGQLTDLVRKSPLVPVIGDGHFALQPVSVDTVGEAFASALASRQSEQRTYQVGGPNRITYIEILQRIADALGKPLRTVRVPVLLMKRIVPMMQRFPAFPLTADQLTMLLEGNVCTDTESLYADLDLVKRPFLVDVTPLQSHR